MKLFWKYIFPVCFGLVIYTTVRLVNDTAARSKFWERPLSLNAIEIAATIVTGYALQVMLNYFVSRFAQKKDVIPSGKMILREFLIVLLCCQLIVNMIVSPMAALTDDGLGANDVAIINIIPALYVLLYFAIVRGNHYLKAYVNNELKLQKITNDQLQTELKLLKAQYHPHFLFNALNTVYFQMDDNVQAAKQSIEKFSVLLRYQLNDQQLTVPLSREIEYLRNYVDLQCIRASEKLKLQWNVDNETEADVYPLLLLPFAENAFKYVGGQYEISISLTIISGQLHYVVKNSIPCSIQPGIHGNGIGLDNLRRRLQLLYPDDHYIVTHKTEESFMAEMRLKLNLPQQHHEHEAEMHNNGR